MLDPYDYLKEEQLDEGLDSLRKQLQDIMRRIRAMDKYVKTKTGKDKYPQLPAIWDTIVKDIAQLEKEL